MRRLAFIFSLLALLATGLNSTQFVHLALEHGKGPDWGPRVQAVSGASNEHSRSACCGHDHGCDQSESPPVDTLGHDCDVCHMLAVTAPLQARTPELVAVATLPVVRIELVSGRLISIEPGHDAPPRAPPALCA
jgi:hypothetical protein